MKVIIAGGRDFNNEEQMEDAIRGFTTNYGDISEVVCGMAAGADTIGLNLAKRWRIPVKKFYANWFTYGKSAGPIRNKQMAEYADALLCFWDGKSSGTKNMIDEAKKAGLKIKVINY